MQEVWKDIYIDNELTHYMVSNHGRVMNTKTNKYLKPSSDKKGYLTVKLYLPDRKKSIKVHTLVANAFYPAHEVCENQVNHKDGNKHNNYVSNLEWSTGSKNVKHAFDNDLKKPKLGEAHPNNRFSEELIHQICELLQEGYKGREIRKRLGITDQYIVSLVKHRKTWRHVSSQYKF